MWASWPDRVSETAFRREGDYLAQFGGGFTPGHYRATVEYIRKTTDVLWYLGLEEDDDAYGAVALGIDGMTVTRDLLDSILEINFLHEQLNLDLNAKITVLDIGAGYGRFAHRFTQVFPNSFVYCTDAIEKSSRICESYLKYRGVDRARVISMDEAERLSDDIDLAVNIHSWSECTLGAINEWLRILYEKRVPNLFLVPHSVHCLTIEQGGGAVCFLPLILDRGLNLVYSRPKFPPGVNGIYPTQYYLFARQENS